MDKMEKFLAIATVAALIITAFVLTKFLSLDEMVFNAETPAPPAGTTLMLPVSHGREEIDSLSRELIKLLGNYTAGNYQNIESVKSISSPKFKDFLTNWVSKQKANPGMPRYTLSSNPKNITITSLNENSAESSITVSQQKIKGFMAEGQGTLVWYKDDGAVGDPEKEEVSQRVKIKFIKENGYWKVDETNFLF